LQLQPSNSTDPFHDESPTSLEIITFSDRASSDAFAFLNSYGIVGLYVSVVLVVGRFLRMMVDQASHRIVYEDMPEVCEDVLGRCLYALCCFSPIQISCKHVAALVAVP